MSTIESVLNETRLFPPPAAFTRDAAIPGMEAYRALCAEAERDYEGFWARLAREHIGWKVPFTQVLDSSNAPFFRWFWDGRLNASWNCLDRHLDTIPDKAALIFEADDGTVTRVSYRELHARVCRFANTLKSRGIGTGDRVIIYLPMSIEAVVAMQACARIGATHSVVFGGFSAKSLHERIQDAGAVAVITADGQFRGGREIPLKPVVDEAFAMGGCEHVANVIVYRRTGTSVAMHSPRDRWWHEAESGQPDQCEPVWVEAEHPLFILYTSGSTGTPKGVQHSTGGYLLHAALTMRWTFDHKPTDIFWCTADVGWITGHTYVCYGPLAVGATQVIFEGVPTWPDASRFWKMIEAHKVTIFYTAPTAIRSLIKAGADLPKQHDLSTLRLLGTVGEPINPEAWMWYHRTVGGERCPIVDTWWQTETGGHMITPLPGVVSTKPGSCTLPLPGVMAAVVDETGNDVENGKGGILVIKKPWPSMIRTVWGNPDRYRKGYYPRGLPGSLLPGRRRRQPRPRRLLLDHGPHRRRAQRVRPSPGHHGDRVRAGGQPTGGRGRGGRHAPRDQGRGGVRVRGAQGPAAGQRSGPGHRARTARLGREGDRSDRQARRDPVRRQPAQDPLGQDHAAPPAVACQGRGNHAGRLHPGEPGHPRAVAPRPLRPRRGPRCPLRRGSRRPPRRFSRGIRRSPRCRSRGYARWPKRSG